MPGPLPGAPQPATLAALGAGWYAGLSFLSLLLYRHDKRRAEHGGWRVPEARLHLIDLLGGWPGGWLARRWYRHKNRKASFRRVSALCIAANVAAAAALAWGLAR